MLCLLYIVFLFIVKSWVGLLDEMVAWCLLSRLSLTRAALHNLNEVDVRCVSRNIMVIAIRSNIYIMYCYVFKAV